jgi:hypothetical protein
MSVSLAFSPYIAQAGHDISSGCIDEQCFETAVKIGGKAVPLRGLGIKRYWGLKLYHAAFYLPKDVSSKDALTDVPKELILRYRYSFKPNDFIRSTHHNLKESRVVKYDMIKSEIEMMDGFYERVRPDDEYRIIYVPGKGTTLYLNDKREGTVPGKDFAAAYFGIWLSEKPINKRLRKELLALRK